MLWSEERVAVWRRTGKHPKVAAWTPEQTGAFLHHPSGARLYPLYHVVTFRGLRRGEAVGLPWSEVMASLFRGAIEVHRGDVNR